MRVPLLWLGLTACASRPAKTTDTPPGAPRGATDCPPPELEGTGEPTGPDATGDSGGADAEPPEEESAGSLPAHVLVNARLPGTSEEVSLWVDGGTIVAVGAAVDTTDAVVTDAEGRYVVPGFIDSHVHLAYLPESEAMAAGGVVAAVDLAAPLDWLADPPDHLRILASGPMITAPAGYPTTSWGRNGYGVECGSLDDAVGAVDALVAAGAGIIKVPLAGGPELDDPTLAAVADRAHHHGVRLGVHALDDAGARRAAAAGADVLVHIPTERLSDAAVAAWADGAVVPTLTAFGSSAVARENLARLHAAGTTVLYGTDFGNARDVGISAGEVEAMVQAGLSPDAVLEAATAGAAAFWGWDDLGSLAPGALGAVVLVDGDPAVDAGVWSGTVERWPPPAAR